MKKISQSTDGIGLHRNEKVSITGLIIAAGFSSRMGDFKPLLIYKSKSFLENIIYKLEPFCNEIIIVTGHNANLIESELNTFPNNNAIKIINNENFKDGMFTSLQKGISHSSNQNWILYHFVDQPAIPEFFYEQIFNEIDNEFDWIQPKKGGRKGHPILLGKRAILEILSSLPENNLKRLSKKNNFKKKYFESETDAIFFDVDTKKDYADLIEQKK